MRSFFRVALIVVLGSLLYPSPVQAADSLTLPLDTVITAEEGSVIELGRVDVDEDIAGPLCVWEASVANQESVHLGNDILMRSAGTELVLSGIEDAPDLVTTNTGSVYLADEVVVLLRMGPDEVFSGGLEVVINYSNCRPAPPTTTETTGVTEPEAPEPSGPTTAPPTIAPTTIAPTTIAPTDEPTTVAPTTEPEGPVLPVTGSRNTLPLLASGVAMIAAGAMVLRRLGVRS